MKVAVLGAGVIGVTTAYFLARGGASVTVVDRQPGPALETSFANGGQISVNHATPWATPSTPLRALKWLGRSDAPLLIHPRWDPALAAWLIRFLANCTRRRLRTNIERALRVALYSRGQLAELRAETGIEYDQLTLGILHIFRDPRDYAEALPGSSLMTELGCERRIVSVDECVALEPALAWTRDRLVGGIFSPGDESGNAHTFTLRLAELAGELGAKFRWNELVRQASRQRAEGSQAPRRTRASSTRMSMSWRSAAIRRCCCRPLGVSLPVYPGKGYSVTIPIGGHLGAPTLGLIDDEFKMVYSRLGDQLRVAGTAEFAGWDTSVTEARARFLLTRALELFPDCGDVERAEFWAGLRPSTPDGVPVIGRTGLDNLFLNTGHGTLGWTMACGSGRVVADLVLGRTPEISLDGLGIDRFH